MKSPYTRILKIFLVFLDAGFLSLSWICAYWMRFWLNPVFGYPVNAFTPYLIGLPLIIPLWLLIVSGFGLYRRPRELGGTESILSLIRATTLGLLVTMSVSFLFRELEFARSVVLISSLSNLMFLGLSRWISHRLMERFPGYLGNRVRALIVGAGYAGARVLQKLQELSHPPVLTAIHVADALLVQPVSRNAVLSDFMHLPGSYLNLNSLIFGAKDRCMYRAITVWFRS